MRNEAQWDHDRTRCSENLAGGVNMTMTILMSLTAAFFIINLAGPLQHIEMINICFYIIPQCAITALQYITSMLNWTTGLTKFPANLLKLQVL